MTVIHVISCSSGKDSDETLRQALARFPADRVRVIFCDTDNEDEAVYEHLAYLERRFGITIHRLRANFEAELLAKRAFIARDVRTRREYCRVPKVDRAGNPVLLPPVECLDEETGEVTFVRHQKMGWDSGRKVRWSNKAKRRALAVMRPSGNAFLDLCMWKGRFPSRKAQFCTQELKTAMAVQYQQALVEQGHRVVSWQGVRRDESQNRRDALRFERLNPRTYAYRPLVDWTALQVFASLAAHDVEVNRLYREGCARVGCMPCINTAKGELRETAVRRPRHIDRIALWEHKVGACSKRGFSTFMADAHDAKDRRVIFADLNIRARVEWSKTTRGGKQRDLLNEPQADQCASAYGLCE